MRFLAATLALAASFGAWPAITTVDTPTAVAIQTAIDKSEPGDTVQLSAGTYEVAAPIQLKSGVRLQGAGQTKTLFTFSGTEPGPFINMSGCRGAEVCHLTLDGQSDPLVTQGVYAGNASELRIHHIAIANLAKGSGFGPVGVHFIGNNPSPQRRCSGQRNRRLSHLGHCPRGRVRRRHSLLLGLFRQPRPPQHHRQHRSWRHLRRQRLHGQHHRR